MLVLVLAVAQLVLPGIAAERIRSQLSRSGEVRSVSVSAFPAIELLWHRADRVSIRLGSFTAATGRLGSSLGQAVDAGSLTATAAAVHIGLLTVRDTTLTAHGRRLTGTGTVAESDLRAAVPFLSSVTPVASTQGALTLRGVADVLGLRAAVDATVGVRGGAIVVSPDVPPGGAAALTAFSSPAIAVTGVSAAPARGGFTVRVTGRVR